MTRINTLPTCTLTNQQAMAEYRELPRIFTAVARHAEAGKTPADFAIPDAYVLGAGHVTFFYDKIQWLIDRYFDLYVELTDRGYSLNSTARAEIHTAARKIPACWRGRWRPTPDDHALNMARLTRRSKTETVLAEMAGAND